MNRAVVPLMNQFFMIHLYKVTKILTFGLLACLISYWESESTHNSAQTTHFLAEGVNTNIRGCAFKCAKNVSRIM